MQWNDQFELMRTYRNASAGQSIRRMSEGVICGATGILT
jgi:hypothetical protein